MALSLIPIYGLVHRAKIVRKADSWDTAGNVLSEGTAKTVYSTLRCRVATMTDEDELQIFGHFTGKRWRVVSQYAPDVLREDFFQVAPTSINTPLAKNVVCRITYVKHQIDHLGRFHHTSLVVEEP